MQRLLKQRSRAHFREHIEAVVTRRTISTERHRDPFIQQFRDGRYTRTEFEIRRRTMDHVSARGFQYLDLGAAQMNAMSQRDVSTSQTKTIEIRNVSQSTFLLDQLTLCSILRSMRMDYHTQRTRETRNSLEQFTRATDRKARRKTVTNATTSAAMPLFE